jgi:hypothetical protein
MHYTLTIYRQNMPHGRQEVYHVTAVNYVVTDTYITFLSGPLPGLSEVALATFSLLDVDRYTILTDAVETAQNPKDV